MGHKISNIEGSANFCASIPLTSQLTEFLDLLVESTELLVGGLETALNECCLVQWITSVWAIIKFHQCFRQCVKYFLLVISKHGVCALFVFKLSRIIWGK
jgi:hypothetical protein